MAVVSWIVEGRIIITRVHNEKGLRISAKPPFLASGNQLLDFAFLVFNVLAHNWVILVDCHFLSHRTCVFLSDVKVASPRGGVQADFDCGWLRHISNLLECGPRLAQRMDSCIGAFYNCPVLSQPQSVQIIEYRQISARVACKPDSV